MAPSALIRLVLLALVIAAAVAPGSALAQTANDDARTIDEDDATTVFALLNDTDADGDPIDSESVDADGDPIEITDLTDLAPPNFTSLTDDAIGIGYEPALNYCNTQQGGSPDMFTYKINGGDMATVSVTVTCVDDKPVAQGDDYTLDEDSGAALYDVLANDTDVDGPAPQIASITSPDQGGTASVVNGKISYEPKTNFCNSERLTYRLVGGTAPATLSFSVSCNDFDDPVPNDDRFTVGFNAGTTFLPVVANDTDPDDYGDPAGWDPIPIIEVTQPLSGTTEVAQGGDRTDQIAYTPNRGFCGTDSFQYRVLKPEVPLATVTVTVPCPALPVAGPSAGPSGGSGGGSGAATTPAAKASAKAGKAKVTGTALKVPLNCTGTATCTISLNLSITENVKASRKKTVVIGKVRVTLKAGQKRTVTVKLNKAGKRKLKKSRKLKAKLKIVLGKKTLTTRTVRFKAKRKR